MSLELSEPFGYVISIGMKRVHNETITMRRRCVTIKLKWRQNQTRRNLKYEII